MNEHIVYLFFRPNGVPLYVGVGKPGRIDRHLKYGASHNIHLRRIIAQTNKTLPVVILREGLNKSEAFEIEIALIKAIGRADKGLGPLVNLTDGGEGVKGGPREHLTPEHVKKIGDSLRGKPKSESHRRAMSEQQTGKKRGPASDKRKAAIAASNKKYWENNRNKRAGFFWINNGVELKHHRVPLSIPEGWSAGNHRWGVS